MSVFTYHFAKIINDLIKMLIKSVMKAFRIEA